MPLEIGEERGRGRERVFPKDLGTALSESSALALPKLWGMEVGDCGDPKQWSSAMQWHSIKSDAATTAGL